MVTGVYCVAVYWVIAVMGRQVMASLVASPRNGRVVVSQKAGLRPLRNGRVVVSQKAGLFQNTATHCTCRRICRPLLFFVLTARLLSSTEWGPNTTAWGLLLFCC